MISKWVLPALLVSATYGAGATMDMLSYSFMETSALMDAVARPAQLLRHTALFPDDFHYSEEESEHTSHDGILESTYGRLAKATAEATRATHPLSALHDRVSQRAGLVDYHYFNHWLQGRLAEGKAKGRFGRVASVFRITRGLMVLAFLLAAAAYLRMALELIRMWKEGPGRKYKCRSCATAVGTLSFVVPLPFVPPGIWWSGLSMSIYAALCIVWITGKLPVPEPPAGEDIGEDDDKLHIGTTTKLLLISLGAAFVFYMAMYRAEVEFHHGVWFANLASST